MKFAYLIIAHNEPVIFDRLVHLLDDERNDIYVHVDSRSDEGLFTGVSLSKANIYFMPQRRQVYWGGESQVKLELDLMEFAKSHGKYDYYHLLSGVDLPLKPQTYIHSFFEKNRGKEFVGVTFSAYNEWDKERKTKYYYVGEKFRRSNDIKDKIFSKFSSLFVRLQTILHITRRYDVKLYKGPNWFSITNSFLSYVLQNKYSILKRFNHTLCPDEIFLQTELMNSDFKGSIYDINDQFHSCVRLIDWHRGNPYVWQSKDFEELMNSDRLFARKFSSEDMEIVEKIYKSLR